MSNDIFMKELFAGVLLLRSSLIDTVIALIFFSINLLIKEIQICGPAAPNPLSIYLNLNMARAVDT